MKYFSEQLNRLFDSAEELETAEAKAIAEENARKEAEQKKAAERKARAAEVEEARKAMMEATKHYNDVLAKFCKDYGAYHCSVKSDDVDAFVENVLGPFTQLLGLI